MRQLLMLGFYCEAYRREPLCRVYVNDLLMDEFNIPHTPRNTPFIKLDPAFWSLEHYQLQPNPTFLKLIEFDDNCGRFLNLRVEIQNNDNNHTNGFMTQYTRVMLCQCWLASKNVWEKFDQIFDRWKYSRHNWHSKIGSDVQYYLGLRNYVLDNLAIHADMHFPDITQSPCSSEQRKKFACNHQHLPQMWQENPSGYWTGTSGHFHLTLSKKLGFWRHSTDRRRGWWKISLVNNMKDLYDKYRSNEDQRSSH